jgi:hypothetical protein
MRPRFPLQAGLREAVAPVSFMLRSFAAAIPVAGDPACAKRLPP